MASLRYLLAICLPLLARGQNSTFYNPILPGFHPDPSCIYVHDWNETFFCASSTFNAFPGIPIHASKDLQNWKLIGNVLNREEQLPGLAYTNGSTSGIWAPSIRYHNGTFWIVTTLVYDDRAKTDSSRWDNIIFKSQDPFNQSSWTNAVSFNFTGYDTSPFWDDDGKSYIVGSHYWHIYPALQLAEANLETGEVGDWQTLWNGTGGKAPEGPHLFLKDDWYYLLAAEGGTGLDHRATIARSRSLEGPYESDPANPILTSANSSSYFQTVGHSDLFQDPSGNWWGVALSTRSGPEYTNYPMGRETVLTPATWDEGEFPVLSKVSGLESGWPLPPANKDVGGAGPWISVGDDVDFTPGSTLPAHFTYWRYPNQDSYTISPEGHPDTLRLKPSRLNLTALNGAYAGPELGGQTFVGRRQQDTLFSYSVNLDYSPSVLGEEAGVTVFLTQDHHLDLGVVLLPANESTVHSPGIGLERRGAAAALTPHIRFRGISSEAVPDPIVAPLPSGWLSSSLKLEIKAVNTTHYSFSVGPANDEPQIETVLYVSNDVV
ncbi:hypothetical protein VPNG_09685 [Cytospora leucostoma]|uniref:Beta-xylosidase C-terminal Concanavalin A-like domain-containing protein n=1 Tax=Cytospora leucostoma TaxID=1230097 RepID=A0A423VJW8_9PEZI|nr:hypothetical protein VPNG_09685 [Cytospora leucostoma]